MQPEAPITYLLARIQTGDAEATDELTKLVYAELHRMAARHMTGERPGHTLSPTALVHEAYLRLAGADVQWEHRRHFFAMAATMMRRILVDHAKARRRNKRGGGAEAVPLDRIDIPDGLQAFDFLAVDGAEKTASSTRARSRSSN